MLQTKRRRAASHDCDAIAKWTAYTELDRFDGLTSRNASRFVLSRFAFSELVARDFEYGRHVEEQALFSTLMNSYPSSVSILIFPFDILVTIEKRVLRHSNRSAAQYTLCTLETQ